MSFTHTASHGIPRLSGRWVRTAALVACALNVNLLLSGVASWSLDGRMMVLQLIIVALATRTAHKRGVALQSPSRTRLV